MQSGLFYERAPQFGNQRQVGPDQFVKGKLPQSEADKPAAQIVSYVTPALIADPVAKPALGGKGHDVQIGLKISFDLRKMGIAPKTPACYILLIKGGVIHQDLLEIHGDPLGKELPEKCFSGGAAGTVRSSKLLLIEMAQLMVDKTEDGLGRVPVQLQNLFQSQQDGGAAVKGGGPAGGGAKPEIKKNIHLGAPGKSGRDTVFQPIHGGQEKAVEGLPPFGSRSGCLEGGKILFLPGKAGGQSALHTGFQPEAKGGDRLSM